jgi:hypothetical protein
LEDDNKNLWISSDNGIFKLNLRTKEISRYDIQDGLQSLEFSGGAYLKDDKGKYTLEVLMVSTILIRLKLNPTITFHRW